MYHPNYVDNTDGTDTDCNSAGSMCSTVPRRRVSIVPPELDVKRSFLPRDFHVDSFGNNPEVLEQLKEIHADLIESLVRYNSMSISCFFV